MARLLLPLAFLLRQRNAEGQDGKKKSVTFCVYCALLTSWWLKDLSQEYTNQPQMLNIA